jgi:hypothetical protein
MLAATEIGVLIDSTVYVAVTTVAIGVIPSAELAVSSAPLAEVSSRLWGAAAGIFVAFGAVLLIQSVYASHGIVLEPLDIALWGLPTALCAFLIHALRLRRFSRRWQR